MLHVALAVPARGGWAPGLGCGRGDAAMSGIGLLGLCGAYVRKSAPSRCSGFAWLPWAPHLGGRRPCAHAGERGGGGRLAGGGDLEPATAQASRRCVFMSGLALLAFAGFVCGSWRRGGEPGGTRQRVLQNGHESVVPFA